MACKKGWEIRKDLWIVYSEISFVVLTVFKYLVIKKKLLLPPLNIFREITKIVSGAPPFHRGLLQPKTVTKSFENNYMIEISLYTIYF